MPAEIVIHPLGEIKQNLIEAVRSAVEQRFGIRATVGESIAVPATAYSHERKQYHSTVLLNVLSPLAWSDGRIRLGIANVDLFVPELNFVFGEASGADGVAVFSIARLDPRAYDKPLDEELLTQRATTEAVHELGHVFGLSHCARPDCVMWFSNTLAETDRKGSQFCPRCAKRIAISRDSGLGIGD